MFFFYYEQIQKESFFLKKKEVLFRPVKPELRVIPPGQKKKHSTVNI